MRTPPSATQRPMNGDDLIVLQELRLHAPDTSGAAARIVARSTDGTPPGVPLLTSIDDGRDVAIVRRLRAGEGSSMDRGLLEQLVERWEPIALYEPRIAEHSTVMPSSYRLAVTESGINDAMPETVAVHPSGEPNAGATTSLGLLWIGEPIGTHAGLLTLIGNHGDPSAPRPDPLEWPLPLARQLGIRIYESR